MGPAPPYVVIGHVVRPHGIRGELRVTPDTDFPSRMPDLRAVLFVKAGRVTPVHLDGVRPHGREFLIKARGIDSIDAANRWRGAEVAVLPTQVAPLSPGQHYVFEVVGLRVETEQGEVLGTVAEILRTGSNDVYVVRGTRGEVLIPAIASVVITVDVPGGRLVVRPLAGLLEGRSGHAD